MTPDQFRELATIIKERVDLVDLIAEHTTVKASGGGYKARCPFHSDKNPSLSISPDKGVYKCHGCPAAGDAITFYSEINHLSPGEAIHELARKYNIPVPSDEVEEAKGNPNIAGDLNVLTEAANSYTASLHAPEGAAAVEELKRRGVTEPTMARFGLGFGGSANAKPTWLSGETLLKRHQREASAVRVGLLSEERKWHYMGDRIVFPIRDERGSVRGFGGRRMGDGDSAKYINTPETPYFKKSQLLYGAYEGKAAIRQKRQAILVEGYMDVVITHQAGVENTVAVMSASVASDTLARLWRHIDDLVICLDGDAAGLRGTLRIIEAAAESFQDGKSIRVALLPHGLDPDEFVLSKGREAFENVIAEAIPASTFLLRHHAREAEMSSPEGRAGFIKAVQDIAERFVAAPLFAAGLKTQAVLQSDLKALACAVSGTHPLSSDLLRRELERLHYNTGRALEAMRVSTPGRPKASS